MPTFKDELSIRGWMQRSGGGMHGNPPPFTHLFLDGGRAAVPDDMHGVFLNLYTNAILRGERVYAVETKTANFKLFFDIDARYDGDPETARHELLDMVRTMNTMVEKFWNVSETPKAVICEAPIKRSKDPEDTTFKVGFHVHWPEIITNSPIALAFRAHVIDTLKDSTQLTSINSLEDILDSCVFKANGLRLVFSGKIDEYRAYVPIAVMSHAEGFQEIPPTLTADQKRDMVHTTSIRVYGLQLTPCRNGIDKLADEAKFAHSRHRAGAQLKLSEFATFLPQLKALLPVVYDTQVFTGVFKTEHALMFKSSSRYCHNVKREHRTSTVYFVVTRRGIAQRCYCRKEEIGCVDFCSEWLHVPVEILDSLLPPESTDDDSKDAVHVMPSKKKSGVQNLHSILSRCKPAAVNKKKSSKGRCKK